jgi:hypothetical protein
MTTVDRSRRGADSAIIPWEETFGVIGCGKRSCLAAPIRSALVEKHLAAVKRARSVRFGLRVPLSLGLYPGLALYPGLGLGLPLWWSRSTTVCTVGCDLHAWFRQG